MSWLSKLENYARQYDKNIQKYHFQIIYSEDGDESGTGMGALIHYKNDILEFFLINDRGQFFVELKTEDSKEKLDLACFLSFIEIQKRTIPFSKLTKEEKHSIYSINYDYSDPLKTFFEEINLIQKTLKQMSVQEIRKIKLKEFFAERGDWLFPPTNS